MDGCFMSGQSGHIEALQLHNQKPLGYFTSQNPMAKRKFVEASKYAYNVFGTIVPHERGCRSPALERA